MVTNGISRIACATALTIAAVVGIQLVNVGAASAQCVGVGAPTSAGIFDPNNGQLLAWETPVAGACNNDGIYTATLNAAGGWTPVLWTRDGSPGNPFYSWGPWAQWFGNPVVSLWAANHMAREFFCAVNDSNGSAWCGIGTSVIFLQQFTSNVWQLAPAGYELLNQGLLAFANTRRVDPPRFREWHLRWLSSSSRLMVGSTT